MKEINAFINIQKAVFLLCLQISVMIRINTHTILTATAWALSVALWMCCQCQILILKEPVWRFNGLIDLSSAARLTYALSRVHVSCVFLSYQLNDAKHSLNYNSHRCSSTGHISLELMLKFMTDHCVHHNTALKCVKWTASFLQSNKSTSFVVVQTLKLGIFTDDHFNK